MAHITIFRSAVESEALAVAAKLKKSKIHTTVSPIPSSNSASTLGSGVVQGSMWVVNVPSSEKARAARVLHSRLTMREQKLSRRFRTRSTTRALGVTFALLALTGLFIIFR